MIPSMNQVTDSLDPRDAGVRLYTVSAPPFIHCGRSVAGLKFETILALMPALAMAIYHFGMGAARVAALSCATAVLCEALVQRVQKRSIEVDNGDALLIGLLLAFMLPASAPWWMVAVGAALAVFLGKHAFGGLGGNPLNPALIGWAILTISWKGAMNIDFSMLNSAFGFPLSDIKHLGPAAAANYPLSDLLLGRQLGGLGASQAGACLLGGLFLLLRGHIRAYVPVAFLAGLYGAAWIFFLAYPEASAPPLFHLLAGGAVFAAFFLATDCASSPLGRTAMLLYGLMGGALVMVIRFWGVYPDGVGFAVLLANLATPILDRIRPRAFGKGRR